MTERKAKQSIRPPMALGYDAWCTHYIDMCECQKCGIAGNNYGGMYSHHACPSCGERAVAEKVGRWVPARGWLWWKVKGYWMIKDAQSTGPT